MCYPCPPSRSAGRVFGVSSSGGSAPQTTGEVGGGRRGKIQERGEGAVVEGVGELMGRWGRGGGGGWVGGWVGRWGDGSVSGGVGQFVGGLVGGAKQQFVGGLVGGAKRFGRRANETKLSSGNECRLCHSNHWLRTAIQPSEKCTPGGGRRCWLLPHVAFLPETIYPPPRALPPSSPCPLLYVTLLPYVAFLPKTVYPAPRALPPLARVPPCT